MLVATNFCRLLGSSQSGLVASVEGRCRPAQPEQWRKEDSIGDSCRVSEVALFGATKPRPGLRTSRCWLPELSALLWRKCLRVVRCSLDSVPFRFCATRWRGGRNRLACSRPQFSRCVNSWSLIASLSKRSARMRRGFSTMRCVTILVSPTCRGTAQRPCSVWRPRATNGRCTTFDSRVWDQAVFPRTKECRRSATRHALLAVHICPIGIGSYKTIQAMLVRGLGVW
mmetsp:Transcript_78797/g.219034  ORF Transcript_78797/g.219034 Transcript_78797/m.219034 type:complete len:227 (+) Transcript_78797:1188-1868(+)